MADPVSCNNPEHRSLITTISEQSRLITQFWAKIQELERKLEVAQQAAQGSDASQTSTTRKSTTQNSTTQSSTTQTPRFTAPSRDNYVVKHDYSPAPSAYETKKTQAQGQLCNYGSACTREQCWYEHPGSKSAGKSKSSASTSMTNQSQAAGSSTKRTKQECRNGAGCTRDQCWFEHPPGWKPPNRVAKEPQPELQEASNTEAPVAELGNWGTSGDSSSWNTAPSDDWSTPVDNTWGAPASADNGWGNSTETNWNTHPNDQPKHSVNNSRSASISMSREGSVSNSSTTKPQNRERKSRGKGRRADSESVATGSAPMSPPVQATTPMTAPVELIPSQTPSAPAEPADQTPPCDETNALDEADVPPLEPSALSSSSEPEAPATPKALWSDEPNIDVAYYPNPPSNVDESQPSAPEGEETNLPNDQPIAEHAEESLNLDQYAPSALYSSWGVTGASASDWGLDPNEFPDPTPTWDNNTSGKKSKSKGKQRETSQANTTSRNTPARSSNTTAQSETSTSSANEPNEPEPEPEPTPEPVLPDPPQGVPQEEIPDWLLGDDEDAHTALGIPREVAPNPDASCAPPRLAPTKPAPRPPLSKLAGENFPSLSGIVAVSKSSQSKNETPARPTFSPRPVGWKITRSSDASSSTSSRVGKGGKPNSWGKN